MFEELLNNSGSSYLEQLASSSPAYTPKSEDDPGSSYIEKLARSSAVARLAQPPPAPTSDFSGVTTRSTNERGIPLYQPPPAQPQQTMSGFDYGQRLSQGSRAMQMWQSMPPEERDRINQIANAWEPYNSATIGPGLTDAQRADQLAQNTGPITGLAIRGLSGSEVGRTALSTLLQAGNPFGIEQAINPEQYQAQLQFAQPQTAAGRTVANVAGGTARSLEDLGITALMPGASTAARVFGGSSAITHGVGLASGQEDVSNIPADALDVAISAYTGKVFGPALEAAGPSRVAQAITAGSVMTAQQLAEGVVQGRQPTPEEVGTGFISGAGLTLGSHRMPGIPDRTAKIKNTIVEAATRNGVDPATMLGLAESESSFNPKAKSPTGPRGIFQFTESTAKQYGVDRNDVESSADGAARYMKDLLKQTNGDVAEALRRYKGVAAGGATERDIVRAQLLIQKYKGAAPEAQQTPVAEVQDQQRQEVAQEIEQALAPVEATPRVEGQPQIEEPSLEMPEPEIAADLTPSRVPRGEMDLGDHAAYESGKYVTDEPFVEHEKVTKPGETMSGVVAKDITFEQARAIDPYAFKKDEGFFIHEEHVTRPEGFKEEPYLTEEEKGWQPSELDQAYENLYKMFKEIEQNKYDPSTGEYGNRPTRDFDQFVNRYIEAGMYENEPRDALRYANRTQAYRELTKKFPREQVDASIQRLQDLMMKDWQEMRDIQKLPKAFLGKAPGEHVERYPDEEEMAQDLVQPKITDAITTGPIEESRQPEYQDRTVGGAAAEASDRNSVVESGPVEEQKIEADDRSVQTPPAGQEQVKSADQSSAASRGQKGQSTIAAGKEEKDLYPVGERVYAYPQMGVADNGKPLLDLPRIGRVEDVRVTKTGYAALPYLKAKNTIQEGPTKRMIVVRQEGSRLPGAKKAKPEFYPLTREWYRTGDPHPYTEFDKSSTANQSSIQMPEIVRLAQEIGPDQMEILLRKMPTARGQFMGQGALSNIKLHPSIFADPNLSARVLAHELGHLVDYLPDETLKRGNILGRLQTLQKYMKENAPGIVGSQGEIRKELLALTEEWRPWKRGHPGFDKYREDSKELYADAISMVLNDPARAKEVAPKFFTAFFDNLSRKPEVESAYTGLMQDLRGGKTMDLREEAMKSGFEQAREERQRRFEARQSDARTLGDQVRNAGGEIMRHLVEKWQPVLKDYLPWAKEHGVSAAENLQYKLEEANLAFDTDPRLLLAEGEAHVDKPLEEAGIPMEDFGRYLTLDRIANGDRAGIANPHGENRQTALEGLQALETKYGVDKMNVMADAAQFIRETNNALMHRAKDIGIFSDDLIDRLDLDKDTYISFGGAKYADTFVSASIHRQKGTLGAIDNPVVTTYLKMMALQRKITMEGLYSGVIDFEVAMGKAEKAKTTILNEPIRPENPRLDVLSRYEDGKLEHYYVDKKIVQAFDQFKPQELAFGARMMSWFNNHVARPAMITYNLTFGLYNNPIRDFQASVMAIMAHHKKFGYGLPSAIPAVMKSYWQNLGRAMKYTLGKQDPMIDEAIKNYAINYYGEGFWRGEQRTPKLEFLEKHGLNLHTLDGKIEKLLGGIVESKFGHLATKTAKAPFRFVAHTGEWLEILPKLAAWDMLRREGVTPEQAAHIVREDVGTPDFRMGGTDKRAMNSYFMFSNIFARGMLRTYRLARNSETAAGWWSGFLGFGATAKLFQYAMTYGTAAQMAQWLGLPDDAQKFFEHWKRGYQNIPSYDQRNYFCVVLDVDEHDVPTYIRIPHEESIRMVFGAMWTAMETMRTQDPGQLAAVIGHVFDYTAGQGPSLAPAIGVVKEVGEYASGNNPWNSYYQSNVLPDDVQKGEHYSVRALKYIGKDLAGKIGWKYLFPDFHRVVKTSALGIEEHVNEAEREAEAVRARDRLHIKDARDAFRAGDKTLAEKIGKENNLSQAQMAKAEEDGSKERKRDDFSSKSLSVKIAGYRAMSSGAREDFKDVMQKALETGAELSLNERQKVATEFGIGLVLTAQQTKKQLEGEAHRSAPYEQQVAQHELDSLRRANKGKVRLPGLPRQPK